MFSDTHREVKGMSETSAKPDNGHPTRPSFGASKTPAADASPLDVVEWALRRCQCLELAIADAVVGEQEALKLCDIYEKQLRERDECIGELRQQLEECWREARRATKVMTSPC